MCFRTSRLLLLLAGALLLGCAACSASNRFDSDSDAGTVCTSCGSCEEYQPVSIAQHISGDIVYADPPPVGGQHNSCWASWGVYDSELRAERWVHNLEHGGVVFLYRCDEPCPDDVSALEGLVRERPLALLTTYSRLPTRFAVVAWGVRLLSQCLDTVAFTTFYETHVNRGREMVSSDPPAACAEFPDL